MARRRPFEIVYDPEVRRHLEAIERKHRPLIRRTIEEQLTHEPTIETRNRKPLIREVEFDAEWELRCGPDNRFRIFYSVDDLGHAVQVLAIGVKEGDRLFIAGEEIEI